MKEHLLALVRAQRHDERISVLQRRLASLPAELSQREAEHAALMAGVDHLDEERKACLSRAQNLENDVRQFETRVAKVEKQARESRDASAVQIAEHEANQWRDKISSAEDEALQLLDRAEQLADEKKEAAAKLEQAAAEMEQFRKTVAQDQTDLEGECQSVQEQRDQALQEAGSQGRDLYLKLLPARKGRAIVPLRVDSCGGCGMVVPPNDRVRVHGMNHLVRCRSCTRILVDPQVWNQDESKQEAEQNSD
ncbi:MAG: hypothetical protein DWQ01_22110 [Planctomycetota bacterium]|nr:MAG: hypothetical protein DWQ01_22110 [Planctomycetota bacterium]